LHDAVAPADELGDAVRLSYLDSLKDAWPERGTPEAAELLEAAFRRRIAELRQKEQWNGVSLVGPQRDDLRVELAGRDVAVHASRGQQRTIILALKLAETDLLGAGGPRPIVLLDDLFSELDPERSERALDLLTERGQVLVTMADLGAIPAARRARVPIWQVDDGRLSLTPRVA
jgi:DNA replication and repair protein RecF